MSHEICPECGGSGKEVDDEGNIVACSVCDGNGFIVTEDDE